MPSTAMPVALVNGAVAGLVGTAALTVAMRWLPEAMAHAGVAPADPSVPKTHGEASEVQERPTQLLAEKVARGTLRTSLTDETQQAAGQAIHWSYGAAWGAVYGLVQHWLRPPYLVHGPIFGAGVGMVASTVVPAMGLVPPPTQQPVAMSAMQFTVHLRYDAVTALTFRLLSRGA